ncbi:MAG TPA: hypothetical protein VL069_16820 [Opitutus sp.]|nr:hypothetical protein [Opitutus sp.]
MKFLCRALCVLLIANCALFAQRTEESIGDFEPLDDDLVLYIPKFAVKLGFRGLTGAKTAFGGTGVLSGRSFLGADTGVDQRGYHDGYVAFDSRTVTDPAGNQVPITPDGRTNNWGFTDSTQATADGLMEFHTYTATTSYASFQEKDPPAAFGVELSVEREIGNVFGTRMKWGVIGGMSINQIATSTSAELNADITTITDLYSLGGQAAPTAPFTGPFPAGGVDNTPLIYSELLRRSSQTANSTNAVLSNWKLRGAYLSFRAGASLFVPISERFSAAFSAGAVLAYAGTTYDVNQSFKPNTGDTIVDAMSSADDALLPGYYVDANLQFAMNETSGLYLGAVYQSSGDYTQTVTSEDGLSKYSTRVDLSALQGVRAGVSFKF